MDFLKTCDNVGGNGNRVNTVIRHRTVTAFSLNINIEVIGGRRTDTAVAGNNRTGRQRKPCHYMNHHGGIDIRIF